VIGVYGCLEGPQFPLERVFGFPPPGRFPSFVVPLNKKTWPNSSALQAISFDPLPVDPRRRPRLVSKQGEEIVPISVHSLDLPFLPHEGPSLTARSPPNFTIFSTRSRFFPFFQLSSPQPLISPFLLLSPEKEVSTCCPRLVLSAFFIVFPYSPFQHSPFFPFPVLHDFEDKSLDRGPVTPPTVIISVPNLLSSQRLLFPLSSPSPPPRTLVLSTENLTPSPPGL